MKEIRKTAVEDKTEFYSYLLTMQYLINKKQGGC